MRRYVVVLAVLGCVVTGCASASETRTELGGDRGGRAADGGERAGQRDDGERRGDPGGERDAKDKHDRADKKKDRKRLEVKLPNVVGEIDTFSSPSMNIGCAITEDDVRCDIDKRRYDPPKTPKDCDLAYGNSFAVGRDAADLGCVSDSTLGASTTLPYGASTRVGDYGCLSRRDGMRCYNLRTGHGFLVSQDVYEFY